MSVGSSHYGCWLRALMGTVVALVVLAALILTRDAKRKTTTGHPPRPHSPLSSDSNKHKTFNASYWDNNAVDVLEEVRELEAKRLDKGCSCSRDTKVRGQDLSGEFSVEVRDYVYKKWRERERHVRPRPPLGLCPANSTFQFVSSGTEIEPMQSTKLVGLVASLSAYSSFFHDKDSLTLTSMNGLGVLSLTSGSNVRVIGNNSKEMTLLAAGGDGMELNTILKGVVYRSTVSVVNEWDTVNVSLSESVVNIHIHIRRRRLPFLYRTSSTSPPISERVTVITKTFERYDELNRLLDSISKFYPNITILVADDSVHFQTVDKKNILQYQMPPRAGWFAGRNLVLSQVTTEYFVWVDDDYFFTEKTKLELFLEKLDKVELKLDMVAGVVPGFSSSETFNVEMDRTGLCLTIIYHYPRGELDGYPQCKMVDRPVNLYMGRTRSAQEIGFNPNHNLRHIGHNEFFLDGYHSLRIAACTDVSVGHRRGGSAFYKKERAVSKQDWKEYWQYNAFKYNAKCYAYAQGNTWKKGS